MNRKGVSVLVGFILLMMTLMLFLALLQTQMIPSICKDAELKNLNEITEELEALDRSIIEDKMTTIPFNLGVRYPKYPFLLSPPTKAAQVIAEPFTINVSYDEILPNGSVIHGTLQEKSDRIIIKLNYFYNRGYNMSLENTAIFRGVLGKILTIKTQQMFTQSGIKILFVNATFRSFSSSQSVDIAVIPVSYGGYILARNVTVNFTTRFPAYWKNISSDLAKLGYTVTVNGNNVSVRCSNVTRLEMSYVLLFRGISITALQYSNIKVPEPVRMIHTNPITNYTVKIEESVVLGVKVLDKYNNPVKGVKVEISSSIGNVNPKISYTDLNGEVHVTFSSKIAGSGVVEFVSSDYNLRLRYNIDVLPSYTGGGGGNITVELSSNPALDVSAPVKTIIAKVYGIAYGIKVPLPDYTVVFATNSSNARLTQTVSTTNSSGIATTTLYQVVSGDNWYKVCAFAGSSAGCLDVRLNGSAWLFGWKYRIPIYIHENSGKTLTDYQVLVVLDSSFNWSAVKADGSDIRFTDSDAVTELPYWIEEWNHGVSAKIWVKVPQIPANGNKTIYMYYGNSSATSRSDFSSVFELFQDDFSADPNTNGKWIIYRHSNDTNNEFYWDSVNKYVYLTHNYDNKGVFAFANVRGYPVKVEFKFKAGGGTGADGLAFGFDKDIAPYKADGRSSAGGSLALSSDDKLANSDGWALELDNYDNGLNDPNRYHGRYIAIARSDSWNGGWYRPNNNYYPTKATEDNQWHTIEIIIAGDYSKVKAVYLDGSQILGNIPIQKLGYGYFGFGAATGGLNNNHIIDDVKIWYHKYANPEPTVTIGKEQTY